ncbi:hypothetical protein [Amycolatopsis sp. GA6-003]|uniref:hypothetical protein n=1 Tax=Amycolatopsis sp. GA6-003 TaxID=2652444 RepID=UPI003916F28B
MPSQTARRRAARITGTAAIAGFCFAAVPTAASAAAPAVLAAVGQAKPAQVCFVNAYNIDYRYGPGTEYLIAGWVNKGQGFDVVERRGHWSAGHLWGPDYTSFYWIDSQYLNC